MLPARIDRKPTAERCQIFGGKLRLKDEYTTSRARFSVGYLKGGFVEGHQDLIPVRGQGSGSGPGIVSETHQRR